MKQIILKTTKIPVVVNVVNGKYFVRGDTSKNNGCLHYTHEWEISFEMRNSNLNFWVAGKYPLLILSIAPEKMAMNYLTIFTQEF